jgi:hypothetical protein
VTELSDDELEEVAGGTELVLAATVACDVFGQVRFVNRAFGLRRSSTPGRPFARAS